MRFLLIIGSLLALPACKKCMTCTSTDKSTGKQVETYPENCGKTKTLDAQELTYRFSLPDSLELKCTRE